MGPRETCRRAAAASGAAADCEGDGWDDEGGYDGLTPLRFAVYEGHVDVVRALVAAGASTQVLDGDGRSLLQVARDGGMKEIEEVLLAAGAACD